MTTVEHAADAAPDDASQTRLVEWILRARTFGIIAVLLLFVAITAAIESRFVDADNIQFILSQTSLYALIAVGEAMVIITRNVDLSVGSIVGLSAYVSANQFGAHPGISIVAVFAVGLGIGARVRVRIGRDRRHRSRAEPRRDAGDALHHPRHRHDHRRAEGGRGQHRAGVVQQHPRPHAARDPRRGRWSWRASSRSPRTTCARSAPAATSTRSDPSPRRRRLAGIPTARRVFGAFLISGGLAGLGGVLWAAQYATITSTAANGLELQVIAAVVVGGVAIFGGSGTVVGAALGALLLQTINSALNVLGIPSLWTDAISGFLLLVAITLDRVIQIQQARALRRRRVRLGA